MGLKGCNNKGVDLMQRHIMLYRIHGSKYLNDGVVGLKLYYNLYGMWYVKPHFLFGR